LIHLVTGGAGYFGEVLVRQLLSRGEEVRVLDLNPLTGFDQVESIVGDIRDFEVVRRACVGVTHVYHNVAQVPLAKSKELFWSVNRDGTRNVLQAAWETGAAKVVHTSSSAIFGAPKSNPVTELTRPIPAEEYGLAKYEAELLCHQYADRGLDISIVRPRTILGHGRLGIFQILFEWVHQGFNIPVLGSGGNIYQFVHAEDLAGACILCAGQAGNETFNVGAERFGTMRESLEGLCAHAGTGSRVRSLPRGIVSALMKGADVLGLSPLAPYHALMYGRSLYFDVTKAKRVLGWSARYSNVEMLCESYDWYCRNRPAVLAGGTGSAHRSAVKQRALALTRYLL
jgi:nucleoside-diphosphate-sugar epimerase